MIGEFGGIFFQLINKLLSHEVGIVRQCHEISKNTFLKKIRINKEKLSRLVFIFHSI
jgi:hypothetical protein